MILVCDKLALMPDCYCIVIALFVVGMIHSRKNWKFTEKQNMLVTFGEMFCLCYIGSFCSKLGFKTWFFKTKTQTQRFKNKTKSPRLMQQCKFN